MVSLKKKKIVFVIAVVVIASAGMTFFTISGVRQPGIRKTSQVASVFHTGIRGRAKERGIIPIEGFDASILMQAYSGLREVDFDGVKTGYPPAEGIYLYQNDRLRWQRTSGSYSSVERTLTSEGYETLLVNLSKRLNMPALTPEQVTAIIDAVDNGRYEKP